MPSTAPSPLKCRKVTGRLFSQQRVIFENGEENGNGRVRRPELYSYRMPRAPAEGASYRGSGRAARAGFDGCRCGPILESYTAQFAGAKRTARDTKQAAATAGRRIKNVQSVFNYARLGVVVIDLLFDGRGSWLVHEACVRDYLKVSNAWLASCHNSATSTEGFMSAERKRSKDGHLAPSIAR